MPAAATPDANPLLRLDGLPPFSAVRPEDIRPAAEASLNDCRAVIEHVTAPGVSPTWERIMEPIAQADDRFSRLWAVVSHLNGVVNTPALREAHDACLPLIAAYSSWAGQYRPLFDAVSAVAAAPAAAAFDPARRATLSHMLRDFKLAGIDLPPARQKRFAAVTAELSQLESDFANHVLDATRAWALTVTDPGQLAGLPASSRAAAAREASARGVSGWVFTLDLPNYHPFMTYADDRELRKIMYDAYTTRASELFPGGTQWDNGDVMRRILALRHEQAQLLGYPTYAHLSLATKTAADPDAVLTFLDDLVARSLPQGHREMDELTAFAAARGAPPLEPWDVAYWAEKLRRDRFAYDAEALRCYFPVDTVIAGMFRVAGELYGLTFRERPDTDVWHPQARGFEVLARDGGAVGFVYLDLYARPGKRGGAWMDECVTRRLRPDFTVQLPVAYLVCNFSAPTDARPAQLTHEEVVTLFHEFGHTLNQLLTRVDVADVSGINGVPWDAVELPSQLHENFAWQAQVLQFVSGHCRTGEPLPADKLANLLRAKNFEAAMAMLRQLEFALFDFRVHLEYSPDRPHLIEEILSDVRARVSVVPHTPRNRFAHSFTHVFAGGYAAGYYSYKWAEVLAADAFGRFLEEGVLNPAVGSAFCDRILAVGGSVEPTVGFRAFRGRDPDPTALLAQSDIKP